MFVLWKDHTATKEAAEINEHATKFDINYLQYVGGIYSSEWFWAKLLHILRVDEKCTKCMLFMGRALRLDSVFINRRNDVHQMKRGVCAAGHKALWAEEFGGLPPNDFFTSLDPLLDGFTSRLFTETYTSDKAAGNFLKNGQQRLAYLTMW